MKKLLICVLVSIFALSISGCADYKEYAKAQTTQNEKAIKELEIKEAKEQTRRNDYKLEVMSLSTNALIAASKTADKTDDVLVPILLMTISDKFIMAEALISQNDKMAQITPVEAPDSIGDTIQKSTGLLLGVGGIVLGVSQADNMETIALAGIAGAGTKNIVSGENNRLSADKYKSGSDNIVSAMGDSSIQAGDVNNSSMTQPNDSTTCAEGGDCEGEGGEGGEGEITCESDSDCSEGQVCGESGSCESVDHGFILEECIANPPGGYNEKGDPLWDAGGCSCHSHSVGHC